MTAAGAGGGSTSGEAGSSSSSSRMPRPSPGSSAPQRALPDVLHSAAAKVLGGGLPGAGAMVVQVGRRKALMLLTVTRAAALDCDARCCA
jgi:hypothetical protein